MGKSSPKPPAAPDPTKTAAAQTQSNKDTAYWNAVLQNVNQVTPYGNLTYSQTGGGKQYNMDAYNAALAAYNASPVISNNGATPRKASTGVGLVNNSATSQQNRGQAPQLSDYLTGDAPPQFTSTIQLTPEMQQLLDSQTAQQQRLSDIGGSQLDRVAQAESTPYSYDGLPQIPGQDDLNADRQRTEDALYARLNPQFDQDEEKLRTRLANQGIMQGSDAYTAEINRLNQAKNDARNQVTLAGGQEQSRLFGLGQANRNQAITEYNAQRNAPLNEYSALTSGVQVQNPSFQNYNYGGAGQTDVAGITQNAYQNALNGYNQKVASNNNTTSSLFGLGGQLGAGFLGSEAGGSWLASLLPTAAAFSDQRLKENIEKIGETPGGFGVYEYNFIGKDEREIGLIAQEVEAKIPNAVITDVDGYKLVRYSMVP